MAFDIEKYIPYPNYYFKVVGDDVYLDGCMHSAVKHNRDYAIALAKHFGLFDGYKEICERFESKQSLHKDDCFAYQVAKKALGEDND